MTSRRSFLAGLVAAAAAPAIVRSESLMKLWVPQRDFYLPYVGPDLGSRDFTLMLILGNGGRIYEIGGVDHSGVIRFPEIVVPVGTRIDEVSVRYTGPGPKPQNVRLDLSSLPA